MGDTKRFQVIAAHITRNYPVARYPHVFDVAGGAGVLHRLLLVAGYEVTTFDPLSPKRKGFVRDYFTSDTDCSAASLIVGLHPDGATDVIIHNACRAHIPFLVVVVVVVLVSGIVII